jgi:ABC-type glycerol-3-phosphate transport system permease component
MLSDRSEMRGSTIRMISVAVATALLAGWAAAELLPVIAAFLSAFESTTQIISHPLSLPTSLLWSNFPHAWRGPQFGQPLWRYAVNSSIAVSVGVALGVAAGTTAGYALARTRTRIALLNRYFVVLLTIPGIVTWVPLFGLVDKLGLLSNRVGLGIVYAAFITPLVTVLMRSYYMAFPRDLIEAAMVDGASEARIFTRIVLPGSLPTILLIGIIQSIWLWNELALAVILMLDPRSGTLPIGITQLRGQFLSDYGYGAQYAALVLAILPIIVLYALVRQRISKSLRFGVTLT